MDSDRVNDIDSVKTYNVGKANATIIETPGESKNLIVDIDGNASDEMIADMRAADGEFDIVITHPHADHARAGKSIAEDDQIEISRFVMAANEKQFTVPRFKDQDKNPPVQVGKYNISANSVHNSLYNIYADCQETYGVEAGEGLILDSASERKVVTLWPPNDEQATTVPANDMNNMSLVMKYKRQDTGVGVLFTGDIEQETEEKLVDLYGKKLDSDVLILPHHGAEKTGSKRFLEAVNPDEIVIPAAPTPKEEVHDSQKPDLETLQRIHDTNQNVIIRWTGAEGRVLHAVSDDILGSSETPLSDERPNGGLSPADVLAIRYAQELTVQTSNDPRPKPESLIEGNTISNLPWEDLTVNNTLQPPNCVYESNLVHSQMPEEPLELNHEERPGHRY